MDLAKDETETFRVSRNETFQVGSYQELQFIKDKCKDVSYVSMIPQRICSCHLRNLTATDFGVFHDFPPRPSPIALGAEGSSTSLPCTCS